MTRQNFICKVCGKTGPLQRGGVVVCAQATPDPDGDRVLDGKNVTFVGGGVCAECLKTHSMEDIAAAPEFKKLLTTQTRASILIKTADAKSETDSGFCFRSYLERMGLEEFYDESVELSKES